VIKDTSVSVGRAYRMIGLNRSLWYYTTRKNDGVVIQMLLSLVEQFPTRGFDKHFAMIWNEGLEWGRSSVLRVYRELKLCHRRKHKRRLPSRIKEPLQK
jgi:putative transposase